MQLASFDARGDVGGLWLLDRPATEIVLRDGWLLPRRPGELLPQDARIAVLVWRRTDPGPPRLHVEGANLLLGGRRLHPGRPEALTDGDLLTVDHRDVGEPAGAVLGGLLVGTAEVLPRPLRCLAEADQGAVEVTRPGAGRLWFQAGIAAAALGALPLAAAALQYSPGHPSRSSLLVGAVGCALAGAIGISASRVAAHAGPVLRWDAEHLELSRRGPFAASERRALAELEGLIVKLDRPASGRWALSVELRRRGRTTSLDHGAHLRLPRNERLPAIAALEARRRDWLEVGRRLARSAGRSPDGFVTAHTDPGWPPERARAAVAAGKISLG
ncbi:MAG: hypothetical protein JXB32_06250 [Deltaproteobacteria bacterium]|nr:hypothetical protein [Deltaproteobacteria bacterium]